MTEKKGFVLYFDAASSLAALCAEQRGELLLALFDYAERTAKHPYRTSRSGLLLWGTESALTGASSFFTMSSGRGSAIMLRPMRTKVSG